ncbi:hypothetical protein CMO88_02515 [Candidatus Woesearchaeota archaeon]|nr:hypothetical protein [Candidatus Woesearchaeota archaeon]|tara:strand:+ start:5800 stop:7047 length:1248 start_codon:yes stop_codon:yes gene_type:complete
MAMIFKNKKGFFFTIIAILIISVLFISSAPKSQVTLKYKIPSTESRISVADDFVETLKTSYIPITMRTSSYSALNALAIYLRVRGAAFSNYDELNSNFTQVMLNGSLACPDPLIPTNFELKDIETCICDWDAAYPGCPDGLGLMRDRNFTSRLKDIEAASKDTMQIQTNFTHTHSNFQINLSQNDDTGPFQVEVKILINYSVNAGLAWWNNTENVSVIFNFEGIEDPLYSVGSQALLGTTYTNVFNQTNITQWNLTNLFLHNEWRRYRHDTNGSSFLTRFTDDDEISSCCGVESLINPFVMSDIPDPDGTAGASIEKTYTDWCFFGTRCPLDQQDSLWNITCISRAAPKFRGFVLDTYHLTQLNLSDPDEFGTNLFYGNTYANDPNNDASCRCKMASVCTEPDAPYACPAPLACP